MDLEEWELLPDDGFLEIHDDGGKKIFSRKYGGDPNSVFKMNYFTSPSPKSPKIADPQESPRLANQLVPVPIQLEQTSHEVAVKEVMTKVPTEKIKAPNIGGVGTDQDTVNSQVFFKKMKENEFVDMKMDSPKSSGRGIVPQIDAGALQFEDRSEVYKGEAMEGKAGSSKVKIEKEIVTKKNNPDSDTKEDGGVNIWKWSLNGVGAICSFGVAAATLCIIIFGSHQRNKQQHQQNQKLRFQIYADEKRIKQVVHHATKLNEAMSAVRGVPLTRAHVTFGGYYDGL